MADNGWSVVDVSPVASGDDAWGVVSTAPAQDHPLDFSRITNEPVGARAKRAWNYLTSYAPGERKLSDVPLEALKNAPGSAGDLISNLYTAVAHPLTTVNTIADVGAGALRNVAKNVLPGSVFNAVDSVQTPGFLGGDNGPAGRRASNAANAVGEMLAHPFVHVGASDGGAHVGSFATYGDTGHLFSQYVRGTKAMRAITSWAVFSHICHKPSWASKSPYT